LQLATIDTAAEIFATDVLARIPQSAAGLARIRALTEAFLAHLKRRIFPGGCFFATVAAQLAAQPGRPRDRIMQMHGQWAAQFTSALRQAQNAGELARSSDVDQLVFEITAMLFRANFAWIITEDERVIDQARLGVNHVLERAANKPVKNKRARSKRSS
jgi:hypothetical protein